MAFESVNTSSLKSAINSCLNSINYSSSEEIISKISSNDVWNTQSRDVLSKSLKKLTNERYKNLEKKLRDYLEVADLIEQYQKLSKANASANSSLTTIINKIDDENETYNSYSSGENADETKANESKNKINDLNSDKNKYQKQISENETKMAKLKGQIEGLL